MNETTILAPRTEQRFAETVVKILESADFTTKAEPKADQEFLMEKTEHTYCAIIKYSRTRVFSTTSAISIYNQLERIWQTDGWIPLVVVSSEIDASVKAEFLKVNPRTEVVDIRNLLYLAAKNRGLYDELAGLMPYCVSGLTPQPPTFLLNTTGGNSSGSHTGSAGYSTYSSGTSRTRGADASGFDLVSYSSIDGDNRQYLTGNPGTGKSDTLRRLAQMQKSSGSGELCRELTQWQAGKGTALSIQYEKLCTKALKQLFSDDLTQWQEQTKSNDELYRFDLICKIKRDNRKDLWEMAEHHFHSKYIIFEFKNYSGKVTQMEVTTTARYLYTKALRAVAFIVSPNGFSEHADKAARGALREEGKLILPLTNAELVQMLQMQDNGDDPADYLSDKLDALLIDLEK